jgi:hypothetical protein
MQSYYFELLDIWGYAYAFSTLEGARQAKLVMAVLSTIYKVYQDGTCEEIE